MKQKEILHRLQELKNNNKAGFAVLIDPDGVDVTSIQQIAHLCNEHHVTFLFLGGSLMLTNHIQEIIAAFKSISKIPIVLFPGHPSQVDAHADGLLFLSLISGRNPELLIGQHVIAAAKIKQSNLEVIPTGYMVIDGGKPTSVSYISNTPPIPHDKPDIALCTAWAGELLGLQCIYMDAGSGAMHAISKEMIHKVASNIDIPLIVGGGIRNSDQAITAINAGAQIVVVGNAIENNPEMIIEIANAIAHANQ
jgi:phosphoglycerol geranylgeranyltransferase